MMVYHKQLKSPIPVEPRHRERDGLTLAGLGEKIGGVPRQHISGMETGTRPIGKETAKKLAAALKADYRAFL